MGLVFQDPDDQVFSGTVWEDVSFGPRNLNMSEEETEGVCRAALGNVGMLEQRNRAPYHLSYGQNNELQLQVYLPCAPTLFYWMSLWHSWIPQVRMRLLGCYKVCIISGKLSAIYSRC
ncbi:hypothetical protein QGM71_17700 [Virgibacillus sp. C22-A2]|uniref:Uncharacterized protein n=1 Tax=Virgibacillus tibetensis TaxID=3042313 RepID=A0ABU6KKC5_9BACI|nr:hypothetical protein [Virgibacillus sp. C22-A2]